MMVTEPRDRGLIRLRRRPGAGGRGQLTRTGTPSDEGLNPPACRVGRRRTAPQVRAGRSAVVEGDRVPHPKSNAALASRTTGFTLIPGRGDYECAMVASFSS